MPIRLALLALAVALWSCGDDDSAPTAAAVDSMIATADSMLVAANTMLATADSMITAANMQWSPQTRIRPLPRMPLPCWPLLMT